MVMSEILYKYRSLENFNYFVDIILNNRLYAASYTSLNDPMEGHYYHWDGEFGQTLIDKIRKDKEKTKICSLSKVKNSELMWTHYSDNQKGVVIGLRVDKSKHPEYDLQPIKYEGLPFFHSEDYHNQMAKNILCYKLKVWKYEKEERIFIQDDREYIDVHIEQIITGRRISDFHFDLIKTLVDKLNPKIKIIKAETIMKY